MTENNEDTLDLRRIISKLGNVLVNMVGNLNFLNPFTKSHTLREVILARRIFFFFEDSRKYVFIS